MEAWRDALNPPTEQDEETTDGKCPHQVPCLMLNSPELLLEREVFHPQLLTSPGSSHHQSEILSGYSQQESEIFSEHSHLFYIISNAFNIFTFIWFQRDYIIPGLFLQDIFFSSRNNPFCSVFLKLLITYTNCSELPRFLFVCFPSLITAFRFFGLFE